MVRQFLEEESKFAGSLKEGKEHFVFFYLFPLSAVENVGIFGREIFVWIFGEQRILVFDFCIASGENSRLEIPLPLLFASEGFKRKSG